MPGRSTNGAPERVSTARECISGARKFMEEAKKQNVTFPQEILKVQLLLEAMDANSQQLFTNVDLARRRNRRPDKVELDVNEGLLKEQQQYLDQVVREYEALAKSSWQFPQKENNNNNGISSSTNNNDTQQQQQQQQQPQKQLSS